MPLVVVAGGKGDVGVTTTAENLAIALARQGRRAVFVDADLDHGGNAAPSEPAPRGSIVDVLAGRRTVHDVLQRGPSGVLVLPGAWPAGALTDCSEASERRMIGELKNLAPQADVAVVDAGSSRGRFARSLWHAADALLVVTTPDAASIRECYAAIKVLLNIPDAPSLQILVNLAESSATAVDVHTRIDTACRRFLGWQAVAAGHVEPCSASRPEEGVLIYPARSTSARALDRVADTLWAQWQQQRKRPASRTSVEATGSASGRGLELAASLRAERAKSSSVAL